MLQVQFIREHKEVVLKGLAKRNFSGAETIIEQVLKTDESRRATQVSLDNLLAESNKISNEIGAFLKSGEVVSTKPILIKLFFLSNVLKIPVEYFEKLRISFSSMFPSFNKSSRNLIE